MVTTNQNTKLEAALQYARQGWHVFPLQPKGKIPLPGSHGFKDATTDENKIVTWWSENPEYNIGVATGETSGIFVVDRDTKVTADDAGLRDIYIPEGTLKQETPNGGYHSIFLYEDRLSDIGNQVRFARLTDVRTTGGYIVVAPSVTTDGEYKWCNDLEPTSMDDFFVNGMTRRIKEKGSKKPMSMGDTAEIICEGQRNDTLYRKACSLRSQGFSKEELLDTVASINRHRCSPPLPSCEVATIVDQAAKFQPGWFTKGLLENPLDDDDSEAVKFCPIRVCDITEDPDPDWLWENYIGKGEITLFCGIPKSGKTTLIADVFEKSAKGGKLITPIKPCKVLVITEEREKTWKRRGAHWEHVYIVSKPNMEWAVLVHNICQWVKDNAIDMIVIDTLSEHARLEDENDSAKVLDAMRVGDQLVKTGAAVVYIHHNRKSGGEHGLAARGSNAIVGHVDVCITVNRVGESDDTRRRLDINSRISNSGSATIEWDGSEYRYVSIQEQGFDENIKWLSAIPESSPGWTVEEIISNWKGDDVPACKTVRDKMLSLSNKKSAVREGKGTRHDPYRYHRVTV